jgi:epoxyqueuosine reductase
VASDAELAPLPENNPLELAPLFFLDDEAFRRRFRRTPVWRAKRRGLLRNAAIALGNRPADSALPALFRGLADDEPVVRAASAWALGRFQDSAARSALAERLYLETDAQVRAEIISALRS